jgi:regulator of sigma E protease
LKVGDVVRRVNGKQVTYWEDVEGYVYTDALSGELAIDIERGGRPLTLDIPQPLTAEILEDRFGLFPKGMVIRVATVEGGKPADLAGVKPGDIILAIGDAQVSFQQLQETIRRNAGREISLTLGRDGEKKQVRVTPSDEGKIGIGFVSVYSGPVENIRYSVLAALPEGIKDAWVMSWLNIKSIYQILVGNVSLSKSVAGPITIAKLATQSAEIGIISFFGFMALLSMNLAIINLLPFPALDGGHALFLVYEGIFRREIPNKVKIALQQVGFVLLLVFMAFVLYNDIVRF